MVLVMVVMACWANARSAILRLFSAMMMLRRFTERPNPANNCCCSDKTICDCTSGLKKLAAFEEARVLFQAMDMDVPVSKFFWNAVLYSAVWDSKANIPEFLIAVPVA